MHVGTSTISHPSIRTPLGDSIHIPLIAPLGVQFRIIAAAPRHHGFAIEAFPCVGETTPALLYPPTTMEWLHPIVQLSKIKLFSVLTHATPIKNVST